MDQGADVDADVDASADADAGADGPLICRGIPCGCQLDGKDLWGQVYYTQYQAQADFVVFVEPTFSVDAALFCP